MAILPFWVDDSNEAEFLYLLPITIGGIGYSVLRLRAISRRFELLVESAPDGVMELDPSGHILSANRAIEMLFGYPREELFGESIELLLPQRTATASDELVLLDGRRIDGKRVPVELKVGTRGTLAAAIVRDASERLRVEEALRVSEARFRTSLENMLDCFGIYTAVRDKHRAIVDFACEYVNDAACRVSGLAREEQVGKRLSEIVPGYQRTGTFLWQRRLVETGEPLAAEDYAMPITWGPSAGSVRVYDVRAVKLGDGFAAAWRDISERKRVEAGLERTRAELERSNAALDEFAQVVSHDLTEPLTTVSLYAQTLTARYRDRVDEQGRELLTRMLEVLDRMQERVHAALSYAELHGESPPRKAVDSGRAAHDALKALAGSIAESRAEVACTSLPMVLSDPTLLQQLFQNLVSNAIKFSADHGTPPWVRISAAREGDAWHFAVADHGMGIEPEDLARIFDPFQRANAGSQPGTGIGLAVCRKIVELHGGRIWAESRPGSGSTFHFTLPALSEP